MSSPSAVAAAGLNELEDLRMQWRRVSRQHVAAGAACGCGIGFSFQASDLELDICDYLESAAQAAKAAGVLDCLKALKARSAGGNWKIEDLLAMASAQGARETCAFIVARLGPSLASMDNLHGCSSFRCDAAA